MEPWLIAVVIAVVVVVLVIAFVLYWLRRRRAGTVLSVRGASPTRRGEP